LLLATFAAVVLASAGCSRMAYVNKVNEAENLSRQLYQTQQENNALATENKEQRLKIANLVAATANAEKERDRLASSLATSNQQLERLSEKCRADDNVLRTKLENQSRTLEDARRRVAELLVENGRMRQEILSLQKAQEEKIRNVASTYEAWLNRTKEEIAREMASEIRKGQVTVVESREGLTVNVAGSVLFEPGQADLSEEGISVLRKAVPALDDVKHHGIRVEGHTDSMPVGAAISDRYPTNLELSVARAVKVARYLEGAGVDPRRIAVAGYAEHRPVADNETPEGRARNRRIEIVLVPTQKSPRPTGGAE